MIGATVSLAAEQRSPTLTVSGIRIDKSAGGPGTVVQVDGFQFFSRVSLYLGVAKGPGGKDLLTHPGSSDLIALLGTVEPQRSDGSFSVRVTIPATWQSGQPISQKDLYIGAGLGEGLLAFEPFTFTPADMPGSGGGSAQDSLGWALLAASFIAAGVWMSRRKRLTQ
jgi:hypothetical protein